MGFLYSCPRDSHHRREAFPIHSGKVDVLGRLFNCVEFSFVDPAQWDPRVGHFILDGFAFLIGVCLLTGKW